MLAIRHTADRQRHEDQGCHAAWWYRWRDQAAHSTSATRVIVVTIPYSRAFKRRVSECSRSRIGIRAMVIVGISEELLLRASVALILFVSRLRIQHRRLERDS